MTGLTREIFRSLLDLFDLDFIARHCHCGRPHSLPPGGYLGLFLFYLGRTMSYKHLCMLFGIAPSVCSRIINKMLRKVVRKLRNHPFAQVRFPDEHKMRGKVDMVQLREPEVDDIIGFMGGVSFLSECTDKQIEQNAFYCGYDCNTMVNNVFAFGPDRKVFFVAVNFPGSWADGALMAHFLAHIKPRIGSYKICVNQGFPRSGDAYGTVGPVTKRTARRLHPDMQDYYLRVSNIHTLLRQARRQARLFLILAGALFHATVTFRFFCSVQKYSIISTALSIIPATCTLVGYLFPSKRSPSRTAPPHFYYCSHTPYAWWCVSAAQGEH